MARRVLPAAAAGWLSVYLLAYVRVVASQEGDVARWYVGLCILAVLACVAATMGFAPATTATTALVLTAAATLVAVLTIGLLLVPAVVALAVAVGQRRTVKRR